MKRILIFNLIFSVIVRGYTAGWILIFFGIIEFGIRIWVFKINLTFLKFGLKEKSDKTVLLLSQILFFVSVVLTFDLNDIYSYSLLRFSKNPPDWIIISWLCSWILLIMVNILILLKNAKNQKKYRRNHIFSYLNCPVNLTNKEKIRALGKILNL